MFFSRSIKSERLIFRALPSVADFSVANFTRDNAWHNLDLSAIVPVEALSVIVSGYIYGNATNKWMHFNGYADGVGPSRIAAQTEMINGTHWFNGQIPLDNTRTIKYKVLDTGVTIIGLWVCGWTILQWG